MLTYEGAKKLLDSARDPVQGIVLPHKRNGRIFWEKPGDPRNRNILVYLWNGRYVGNGREANRGSMAERRRIADEDRIAYFKHEHENGEKVRRVYHGRQPIVTLFPNGNYMLWGNHISSYGAGEILRLILPEVVGYYGRVILPDGPRPKLRRVPKVTEPRYWPDPGKPPKKPRKSEDVQRGYRNYEWLLSSWKNAVKGRAWYERELAKWPSLEAWFEAYYKAAAIRDENNAKVYLWRSSDSGTLPVWRGVVFDKDGIATKTSARAEVGRVNRIKREKEARERKAQQERDRKLRAWERMMKDADVKKIVKSLDPDVADYLRLRGIVPNPDGTATLMKFVREDYGSGFDPNTKYKPGTVVEDKNFQGTTECGHGLHFAATVADCARWCGPNYSGRTKQIICDVNLADAVAVGVAAFRGPNRDHYIRSGYTEEQIFDGVKIKASKCRVLGDGDGTDSRTVVEKPKRRTSKKSS